MTMDYNKLRYLCKFLKREVPEALISGDPKVTGIIEEANGRIHLMDFQYQEAEKSLRESFLLYQNTGNPKAKDMIKLYTIANILSNNEFGPFDLPQVRIYQSEPDIELYKNLRLAFEQKDHKEFLQILNNKLHLEQDNFTKSLVPELKRVILQEFVLKIIPIYSVLSFSYLEKELSLSRAQVKQI